VKHIILGTAGHVDHGKTSLIKLLTGVDTDRLKEEKERGITIELGFASLALPDGRMLGVVDVPGHERFIKNMVAGAGSIDLVVMVIAADEGVMPQTKEHLHICSLLGIKKGLVALTKIDLVDESWIELVADDIAEFLKGTFLESSPIVPVSVATGKGLPEFIAAVGEIVSQIEEKADSDLFRLPVDRVFTIKGFGTVVTGTLLSGRLCVGDEVEILPGRLTTKVRGLQVHGKAVEEAESGQRTAVNLQGLEKEMILRGNVLAHPATLEPSHRLDVFLERLADAGKKLRNRSLVRLHVGTSEIIARVVFIDRSELVPGDNTYAQFTLESPACVIAGDRFVIRSYSPVTTIGGGVIVDPQAAKHKGQPGKSLHDFSCLYMGTDVQRTALIAERAGIGGITMEQLVARTGINRKSLKNILSEMFLEKKLLLADKDKAKVVAFSAYKDMQDRIMQRTAAYHEKFPLKGGIHKEELRTVLGRFIDTKLFHMAIKDLEETGLLVIDRESIRLSEHRVNLEGELEQLREEITRTYLEAGLAPPTIKEAMAKFADRKSQAESVFGVILKEGSLVKISEDLYFHKDVLHKLREDYRNLLIKEGKATPANFKELTGLSRKFIIPLMEYFDITKLTIRAGDHRILREVR